MAKSWYFFFGEDYNNPESYIRLPGKHVCLCGDKLCAIYAEGINQRPNAPLSANIQRYIKLAIATRQLQPEFPPLSRKYVYLKDY